MELIFYAILGLLPSFGWLIFYLQEDIRHPEPKKLIFYTFIAGALSTIFVLNIQLLTDKWMRSFITPYGFVYLLILGAIEEIFKFLAAYLTVGHRKELDEPVDAMIYMIVAALGFSAVENIASVFQVVNRAIDGIGPLETITLRFIGATLLHTLTSGIIGYYWGKAMAKKIRIRNLIGLGLVLAILLHAVFNYFIINFESVSFSVLLLVIAAFFILSDFEKLKRYDTN